MKIFEINEKIKIVCDWKKTRTAFKHTATLFLNNQETEETKICYQNRTWESYEYQSVMFKLVRNSENLSKEEKEICNKFIKRDQTDWSAFKHIAMTAKIGEVICNTQTEKNDWKLRMIKAGLENKGLQIPEDWPTLSEEEKEQRLNKVLEVINSKSEVKP